MRDRRLRALPGAVGSRLNGCDRYSRLLDTPNHRLRSLVICVIRGVRLAHQMHGVAVFALGQGVMLGELDPVPPLVGRQDSAPLAQGTYAIERRQDRRPNELRPVGDSVHRRQQGFVHLERDDFLLFSSQCSWDYVPRQVLLHRITDSRLVYPQAKNRLPSDLRNHGNANLR